MRSESLREAIRLYEGTFEGQSPAMNLEMMENSSAQPYIGVLHLPPESRILDSTTNVVEVDDPIGGKHVNFTCHDNAVLWPSKVIRI